MTSTDITNGLTFNKLRLNIQKDNIKFQIKALENQLGLLHLILDTISLEEEKLEGQGSFSVTSLDFSLLDNLLAVVTDINSSLPCFIRLGTIDMTTNPLRVTVFNGDSQALAYVLVYVNELDHTDIRFHVDWESPEFQESRSGSILHKKIQELNSTPLQPGT